MAFFGGTHPGGGAHRWDTGVRGQIPSIILYCAIFKLINDYD